MSCNYANQTGCKPAGATHTMKVDFTDALKDSALLTGTPTIVEVTTSDLTIDNKAINTAEVTVRGEAVAIGKGVLASVSGGTANTTYTIKVTVSTDETATQTFVTNYLLEVKPDS